MKALCFAAPLTSTFKLHFQPWQRFSEHSLDVGRHFHQQPKLPSMPCGGAGFVHKVNCEVAPFDTRNLALLLLYCQNKGLFSAAYFSTLMFSQESPILSDVRLSLEVYGRNLSFQTLLRTVSPFFTSGGTCMNGTLPSFHVTAT